MTILRLSAASFKAGLVNSFDDFAEHVICLVKEAAEDKPDFLIFPELFTGELMNFFEEKELEKKFARLTQYTDYYMELFKTMAKDSSFYILAGTHLKEVGGKFYNTSHLFTPDGNVLEQRKCHLFPVETAWTTPGEGFSVFETEKAKLSILTCYDLEFPEAARFVTLKGADLILAPSATLDEQGYWRVRHCGQARCIENQIFVVHCSLLGNVANIPFWGMASILTPCDKEFPSKGIAAGSTPNVEGIITADVDTELLYHIRQYGSAPILKDRRWDVINALYEHERDALDGIRLNGK